MAPNDTKPLAPLWPDAPKWCPHRCRPAYAYVRGLHPHPTRDPGGHSHGEEETPPPYVPPSQWPENDEYLYGIDLYHEGYLWESHEAWEGLWNHVDRESPEGLFYRALILNSAAQLKAHRGNLRGAGRLSRGAYDRLRRVVDARVCDAEGRFMGLSLPGLMAQIVRHYGGLWEAGSPERRQLQGLPPRLALQWPANSG